MMTTDEYTIETISDAFDRVQNLEAAQNRTERDITRMVLKKLQETKKKALRKKTDRKEISHEAMAKFIME